MLSFNFYSIYLPIVPISGLRELNKLINYNNRSHRLFPLLRVNPVYTETGKMSLVLHTYESYRSSLAAEYIECVRMKGGENVHNTIHCIIKLFITYFLNNLL